MAFWGTVDSHYYNNAGIRKKVSISISGSGSGYVLCLSQWSAGKTECTILYSIVAYYSILDITILY